MERTPTHQMPEETNDVDITLDTRHTFDCTNCNRRFSNPPVLMYSQMDGEMLCERCHIAQYEGRMHLAPNMPPCSNHVIHDVCCLKCVKAATDNHVLTENNHEITATGIVNFVQGSTSAETIRGISIAPPIIHDEGPEPPPSQRMRYCRAKCPNHTSFTGSCETCMQTMSFNNAYNVPTLLTVPIPTGPPGSLIEIIITEFNPDIACQSCYKEGIPLSHIAEMNTAERKILEQWCERCIEEYSGTCTKCGEVWNYDYTNSADDGENRLCNPCFEEAYFECNDCGENYPMENAYSIDDDGPNICGDCRADNYHFCQIGDHYCDRDAVVLMLNGNPDNQNSICKNCQEDQPSRYLQLSHIDGYWIDIEDRRSYTHYDGEMWPITWLMDHEAINSDYTILIRNWQANGRTATASINSQNKQSLPDLLSYFKTRSRTILEKFQAKPITPDHTQIYIGLEMELVMGEWFKYETINTKFGKKNKTLIQGPNRMLSSELPGFTAVHDGSISPSGMEFLPPVIKRVKPLPGAKKDNHTWESIKNAVKSFLDFKWTANDSCGLHFHFSQKDLSEDKPELIRNIFRIFYYIEPLIYACLPPERKKSPYCQPLAKFFTEKDILKDLPIDYWYYSMFWKKRALRPGNDSPDMMAISRGAGFNVDEMRLGDPHRNSQNKEVNFSLGAMVASKEEHYYAGRYIGCNLHALFTKGTLELRYFPMVLDYAYIKNWGNIMKRVIRYGLEGKSLDPVIALSKNHINPKKLIEQVAKVFELTAIQIAFLKREYGKQSKALVKRESEDPSGYQMIGYPLVGSNDVEAIMERALENYRTEETSDE